MDTSEQETTSKLKIFLYYLKEIKNIYLSERLQLIDEKKIICLNKFALFKVGDSIGRPV
jgi:hypothetical protein